MRKIIMKEGRIDELIVDHDQRSIVIIDRDDVRHTYNVSDFVRIMDDEHFAALDFEALDICLPVYTYVDEDKNELLFVIVAQNESNLFQIIDVFDERLISSNNMVKINDACVDVVVDENFQAPIKKLLSHKQLLVFYTVSTKSIPALVNPKKIIIL